MVYVQMTMEIPRNKIQEAWQIYQEKIMEWDKKLMENVGGKHIGYWYTEYGKTGEITLLLAYPSLDVREKVLEAMREVQDEEVRKGLAEWMTYVPNATVKVLRPLPSSLLD